VKLEIVQYQCPACGSTFSAPNLIGGDGYLLLRSEVRGTTALVNTYTDRVFDEVESIVDGLVPHLGPDSETRAELILSLFGRSVDPDVDGSSFVVNLPPMCPVCGRARGGIGAQPILPNSLSQT
jgi:hypothetical protein